MQCELCGKDRDLFKTIIEGSEMDVCNGCSGFGNVIKEVKIETPSFNDNKSSKIYYIKKDYFKLIKENREKLGIKQKTLAKKMNIKESLIHKVESKVLEPSMDLAREFERFFNIKLIESYEEKKQIKSEFEAGELTIGDLLKEKR